MRSNGGRRGGDSAPSEGLAPEPVALPLLPSACNLPAFASPTAVARIHGPAAQWAAEGPRKTHPMPEPNSPHEARFTRLDLKAVAADGAFEGYASLFGREDLGHDVVLPGAFRDTLAQRGAAGVKLLFQHDPAQPIGVWDTLREDAKGLFAQGRLMLDVARAREVFSLMRAGAIDGLSIGFKAVKTRRDRAQSVRKIEKIDLWEISIVTFPMLPEARISAVKARPFAGRVPTERDFERWLTQDAGLTRTAARAILRHGFQGLAAMQAAAGSQSPDAEIAVKLQSLAATIRAVTPTARTA